MGYALAAVAHALFALYLVRSRHRPRGAGLEFPLFAAALVASSLWAAAQALDPVSHTTAFGFAGAAFDLARYGLWFAFLLLLLGPARRDGGRNALGMLGAIAAAVWLAGAATWVYRLVGGVYRVDDSMPALVISLGMAIFGALLTEQLFRNLPDDSRWNAKPVCLGLAVVFVFDVFFFSEAALFGRLDPDAMAIRGPVHMLALPLLFIAATRRGDWLRSLQVSHTAAFYSATLVLAGAYLLFMAAVGYYVRYFGGQWGRALQLGLLFAAGLALLTIVFSASLRARLRVFVHKNFFSYRYDYRQEWLHFTAMLSSQGHAQDVGALVIRGLANMVECPGGALWTRSGQERDYRQTARWNVAEVTDHEAADTPFCRFLREKTWVIDLDEYRTTPRVYGQLAMPLWLLSNPNTWLVVPLPVGEELLGFVTLVRPRAPMELDWEVRDLLKTASTQAAGFIAQMQATEALLEARKFEAFNRMSAFVVHDLKNIITQLSLMLKNAERLHDNPEFQQDMLLTVQSSVEKMRRLMLQLREGAAPPGGASGVELTPILRRIEAAAVARGRRLELEILERLATRGHDDRLERVLGHLVQNAFDATPPEGRVWVRMQRYGGQVKVDVGDTGVGMSMDFVKTRLFRPFSTTKSSGMGIGTYESAQYIRELGGSIDVQSTPGEGTVVSVVMPLFDARDGSDLQARSDR